MSTYETNIPGASGYAGASLLATNAYNNALARLNQKRMGTLRNYGYTADVNSGTGVLDNLRVDPSNPYGQYQGLLRSGAADAEQAQGDAQARGLHGGLAHQLEDDAKYTFGANSQQLGTNLNNDLTGYQDEQTSAAYERDNALWQAQHQAEQDAIAAGAYNQADYSGLDTGNYGDNGPPPPDATNIFASGGQADPFANLANLSHEDWAKLANLPINKTKAKVIQKLTSSPGSKAVGLTDTTSSAHVAAAKSAPKKKGGK